MANHGDSSQADKVIIDKELKDLIPGFMKNRGKDVIRLRAALANGDFAAIGAVGHEIKGIGGGYGFPKITTIGDLLESEAKNANPETVAPLIEELARYIQTVRIEFTP